jgi:hypothetical protein
MVPRWAIAAAVVLALVPAVWFTAQRVVDNAAAPTGSATDLPIPPVSPSTTASAPTPTPTQGSTAPAPSPSAAPVRLTKIDPDAPRRLVSGSLLDSGFDSAATTLDASSTSEVARWESRGSPGSPGTDTVFVAGRVDGSGSAFDNLPRLRPGAEVSIRTDSGTLTYTVTSATLKTEAGLAGDPVVTAHAPGRLVLVGIRYDGSGNRQSRALVVTARLTGAETA